MLKNRPEILGFAGAAAFLLLLVVGALFVGTSPPSSSAPAATIALYFKEHAQGHLINMYLAILGGFFFYPMFLATLWGALRRSEETGKMYSTMALIGGMGLLAPLLLQAVSWGTAALEAGDNGEPSVIRALMQLGNLAFTLALFPLALLIGSTSILGLRNDLFPRWVTVLGLVLTSIFLIGGVAVPGLVAAPAFALFGVWMLLIGITLVRRATAAGGMMDHG